MPRAPQGPPSREAGYRHDFYLQRRFLDTADTEKLSVFGRLMRILYEGIPQMGQQRISWLHTLSTNPPTQRFKTHKREIAPVIDKLRGEHEPLSVEDIGSGGKGISKEFRQRYPNARHTTMDIDGRVRPDIKANFLRPSTYTDVPRPELIVTRYELISESEVIGDSVLGLWKVVT